MRFSEKVLQKARGHLVRQEVVYRVKDYTIRTDANPVTGKATWAECTCQANTTACSHIAAVLLYVNEPRPIPVDDIHDYVHEGEMDDG